MDTRQLSEEGMRQWLIRPCKLDLATSRKLPDKVIEIILSQSDVEIIKNSTSQMVIRATNKTIEFLKDALENSVVISLDKDIELF